MFHYSPSHPGGSGSGTDAPLPDYESFASLLRLVYLKPLQVAGSSRFASYLALYLPEVASRLEYDDLGVLHLEMGVLKRVMRDAIISRNWSAVSRYFAEVGRMMEDAGQDVVDAICVSLLGSLFYGETALSFQKARTLLPARLRVALGAVEQHYREIAA